MEGRGRIKNSKEVIVLINWDKVGVIILLTWDNCIALMVFLIDAPNRTSPSSSSCACSSSTHKSTNEDPS